MNQPDPIRMDTVPVLLRSESLISRQVAEASYQQLLAINSGRQIARPVAVANESPVDLNVTAKDIATRILRALRRRT